MKKNRIQNKRIGTALTSIYVGKAGKKGRGVYAKSRIKAGAVIEVSPFIELPSKDARKLEKTIINSYWFDVKNNRSALGLGYTSLYNHSDTPNSEFAINSQKSVITITALKTIHPHEEITTDYGYEPEF